MSKELLFKPRSNAIARLILLGGIGGLAFLFLAGERGKWSSFITDADIPVAQPVPFSHQHHVGELGIDCRYCHTSVELSSTAGMPSTHTCMTCHSQIWSESQMLEPVRRSYKMNQPLVWNRVYRLPHYVYFNHSIHIAKGVECTTCHGQIQRMPLTQKANSFYMKDCLECHRNPDKKRIKKQSIQTRHLTDCTTCHR